MFPTYMQIWQVKWWLGRILLLASHMSIGNLPVLIVARGDQEKTGPGMAFSLAVKNTGMASTTSILSTEQLAVNSDPWHSEKLASDQVLLA